MSKSPSIEFKVERVALSEVQLFCAIRGFEKSGQLARFALFQYMRRYALKPGEIEAFMKKGTEQDGKGQLNARAVPPEPDTGKSVREREEADHEKLSRLLYP